MAGKFYFFFKLLWEYMESDNDGPPALTPEVIDNVGSISWCFAVLGFISF